MQQIPKTEPADAHKLAHRLLRKERSSQNSPPYADNNSTLPQITEVQQHFQP